MITNSANSFWCRAKNRIVKYLGRAERGFLEAQNLKPSDVFLVSYPRSGNTWVRAIIAHMLYSHDRINSLDDLDVLVPDIHVGVPENVPRNGPRVIKTHRAYPFRHEKQNEKLYNKIIYIRRHPFEVAKSFYDYLKNERGQVGCSLRSFVSRFSYGSVQPGAWQSHIMSWSEMYNDEDILHVSFENLKSDTTSEIMRIANFLDISIGMERSTKIKRLCTKDKMRKMEDEASPYSSDYDFVSKKKQR